MKTLHLFITAHQAEMIRYLQEAKEELAEQIANCPESLSLSRSGPNRLGERIDIYGFTVYEMKDYNGETLGDALRTKIAKSGPVKPANGRMVYDVDGEKYRELQKGETVTRNDYVFEDGKMEPQMCDHHFEYDPADGVPVYEKVN